MLDLTLMVIAIEVYSTSGIKEC